MTTVRLCTTLGDIEAELFARDAPSTAANFIGLVADGAFDAGEFHRVVTPSTSGNELLPQEVKRGKSDPNGEVPIHVIQAGPHRAWQDADPIPLETTEQTGLSHLEGTLSMGRSEPDSATSAFFICIDDQPELDFGGQRNTDGQGFAAFGRVVSGMDVVKQIAASRSQGQKLEPPIQITEATVIEAQRNEGAL